MMIISLGMNLQKLEKNLEILVIEGGVGVDKERKGKEGENREREEGMEGKNREREEGKNRERVT